jgi:hypothetical protein
MRQRVHIRLGLPEQPSPDLRGPRAGRHYRPGDDNQDDSSGGQYYKLFTAIITPLVAYFSMILTELRQ